MIYDCFTFFNELDLLELRLHELDAVVDKFVLVEATYTHQNKAKPLFYELNKARFATFHHKIIHIIVEDKPTFDEDKSISWALENHQRQCIMRGLSEAKPNDVVIISDLDEIPRAALVRKYAETPGIKVFLIKNHYYFINCLDDKKPNLWQLIRYTLLGTVIKKYRAKLLRLQYWFGPMMADFNQIQSPQYLRDIRENVSLIDEFIEDGGWHFSYLGGVDRIITKLEAFAHTELNHNEIKDKDKLLAEITSGRCFHDPNARLKFITLDKTYPSYLLSHMDDYKAYSHFPDQ